MTTAYADGHFEQNLSAEATARCRCAGTARFAMRKGGVVSYLSADHLGSASLATDSTGAVVANSSTRYYPYGATRSGGTGMPTDYRFTGQLLDGYISLYLMGAREYDPSLARWISPDSMVPDPANPQSLNRYSYCLSNPLRYVDPTGHQEKPLWQQVVDWIVDTVNKISSAVEDWWLSHSPCVMSLDPSCGSVSFSAPDVNETVQRTLLAQGWAGGLDWQTINQIAQVTDQAQRLAQLSKVFHYTPGDVAPGSFGFATSSRQEQLDAFAKSYFSDMGDIKMVYGGDMGTAKFGILEDGTIMIGEQAFQMGWDEVGASIFHELLEQFRGDLTHEQIIKLEELWVEWYKAQQQP